MSDKDFKKEDNSNTSSSNASNNSAQKNIESDSTKDAWNKKVEQGMDEEELKKVSGVVGDYKNANQAYEDAMHERVDVFGNKTVQDFSRIGRQTVHTVSKSTMNALSSGDYSQFGVGVREFSFVGSIAKDAAGIAAAPFEKALNAPMKSELEGMMLNRSQEEAAKVAGTGQQAKFSYKLSDNFKTSVNNYRKTINNDLVNMGYKSFGSAQGMTLANEARSQVKSLEKYMRENGGNASLKEMELLNKYKEAYKIGVDSETTLRTHKHHLSHLVKNTSRRIARNGFMRTEFGQGYALTKQIVKTSTRSVSIVFRTAKNGVRLAGIAATKVQLTSAKAALAASNKLKKGPQTATKQKVTNSLENYSKHTKKSVAKRQERKKRPSFRDRVRGFVRDPFGLRSRFKNFRRNVWQSAKNRFKPLNAVSNVFSRIAHGFSGLFGAIGHAKRFIFIGGGALFGFFIIIAVILSLAASAGGAFDFNSNEKTVKETLTAALEECYEEDMETIIGFANENGDLSSSVTLEYDDIMNSEVYDDYKDEHEEFEQVTNCGELLSITYTRFGLDPQDIVGNEDESLAAAKDYLTGMYHGSHVIYKNITTYTDYYDSNGDGTDDAFTVSYSGSVKYQTTYFDGIFSCSEMQSTPVIDLNASGVAGVESERDFYLELRNAGCTHAGACAIMGNVVAESNWDTLANSTASGTDSNSSIGICQWTGGRKTALINFCNSNYLDYNSLTGQVAYLIYEISTDSAYSISWQYVTTKKDDVQACTEIVRANYERPAYGSSAISYGADSTNDAYHYSNLYSFGTPVLGMHNALNAANNYMQTYDSIKDSWQDEYNSVVSRAKACLGKPYVWGATGPDAYDCSGLVGYCLTGSYSRIGTTLTFMTWPQVSDPKPGDICTTSEHCGIYIGNGQMIDAPHTGAVVRQEAVQSGMIYVRYPG